MYFEVSVHFKQDNDNGKSKTIRESYLVDSMTVTEAEAKVVGWFSSEYPGLQFDVKSAKQSRIVKVID